MTDLDVTTRFLNALLTYGPALLSLVLFMGAVGLPVPGTLFLIATGAFVQQGKVDGPPALLLALAGVMVGDSIGYFIGRFASHLIPMRFKQGHNWQQAQMRFKQHGGTAIYLTRFLFIPLAVPTNWIAGASHYSFGRFLRYDILGDLTWIAIYGGLGYLAGRQWRLISQIATDYSVPLMALALLILIIYYWTRSRITAVTPSTTQK